MHKRENAKKRVIGRIIQFRFDGSLKLLIKFKKSSDIVTMKILLTALSVFFLLLSAFSQERTSDSAIMKNSIRVNLSNPFVFGRKAIILGYERQLANNKSFSINIGGMSLPRLKNIGNSTQDSVILLQNNSDGGFHFSTDFRFYLKKENKFAQPHGLYIGPYVLYNRMRKTNTWDYTTTAFTGDFTTDLSTKMLVIGGQMGYQFPIGKHFSVDMVMFGPGLGFYKYNVDLNTTMKKEQQTFLFKTLNDFVGQYVPAYRKLYNEGVINFTGESKKISWGYRYIIHLCYRF